MQHSLTPTQEETNKSVEINKIFKYNTREEAIRSKNWAAGSHKQLEAGQYLFNAEGVARYETVLFPPSFHKIIDEPIVNALDQVEKLKLAIAKCANATIKTPAPAILKNIIVNLDLATGEISITNDGAGIPIGIQLETGVYTPEFCCAYFDQGSNNGSEKNDTSGGVNGFGLKVVNTLSSYFKIETHDGSTHYSQVWRKGKSVREEPIITKNAKGAPMTCVKFIPDYEFYGYTNIGAITPLIADLIRTRLFMASAYVNKIAKVAVYFNNALIPTKNIKNISDTITKSLYPDAKQIDFVIEQPHLSNTAITYPWEVSIIVAKTPVATAQALTNVNGIVVCAGKHVKFISSKLLTAVDAQLKKKKDLKKATNFNINYISKNIIILCNLLTPAPNWTSQRKDFLDSDIAKTCEIPDKSIKATVEFVKDIIIDNLYGSNNKKTTKKKETVEADKYRGAGFAGKANKSKLCTLFMVEGDSAMTPVYDSIKNNKNLGTDLYGVISLGGVIINVRKESKVVSTKDNNYLQPSAKMTENAFIKTFLLVSGLNLKHKYDPLSSTYGAEMGEMRYGKFRIAVDQDLDGNNICGLIINVFDRFWPNLLIAGVLEKMETPIIRCYPKKGDKVLEFFDDLTFADYKSAQTTDITSTHDIRYYKGLATHSNAEVANMFKTSAHIYTINHDPRASATIELYYGKDTAPRKIELATRTSATIEDVKKRQSLKRIDCSAYLKQDVKLYQLDNICRKLDSAIDGMNQGARKIYNGCLKYFKSEKNANKDIKAEQLAGFIANKEIYHHGASNLADSILNKTFLVIGGIQLPQLIATGQSGSRFEGGNDSGAPRYVGVKANKRCMELVYPSADYYLLDFITDEGRMGEPEYFIPIIPTAVLESKELPGNAWKMKLWGRDVFAVIARTVEIINAFSNTIASNTIATNAIATKSLPFNTRGFTGDIRKLGKAFYCVGTYRLVSPTKLIITDLPLRVWTKAYFIGLQNKLKLGTLTGIVAKLANASGASTVEIVVSLECGAIERINESYGIINGLGDLVIDGIEDYFGLFVEMTETANLVGDRSQVIEFARAEDSIAYWFPYRKRLYEQRVIRDGIVREMEIMYEAELIKYLDGGIYASKSGTVEDIEQVFRERGFVKFNESAMIPKHIKNCDIMNEFVSGSSASYSYLLNVKESQKNETYIAKKKHALQQLRNTHAQLQKEANAGAFIGSTIWLEELAVLEAMIRKGIETNWLYEANKEYKFSS